MEETKLIFGMIFEQETPFPCSQKQKPSIAFSDLNDVTLGSSAIFENQSLAEVPE